jgi:hypothetical protein
MTVQTATWVERDGVLRSTALEALGCVAGFTTRALGSMAGSSAPHDEQARNRAALAERLGFRAVARVKQVHGARIVRADPDARPWPEADGMWTDERGLLLGVAGADCVSVLVAEPDGLLGAAHAGWQGASRRVAQELVRALAAHGARPERLVAALGPAIGPCCYTIDADRAALIRERLGADAADALSSDGARITFDLWAASANALAAAGVREIEISGICTRCGGADVWSYRGQGSAHGTALGVIGWPV